MTKLEINEMWRAGQRRTLRRQWAVRYRNELLGCAALCLIVLALSLGGCATPEDLQPRNDFAWCNTDASVCTGWRGEGPFLSVDDAPVGGLIEAGPYGIPVGYDAAPPVGDHDLEMVEGETTIEAAAKPRQDIAPARATCIEVPVEPSGVIRAVVTVTSDWVSIDAEACL